ncbi:MAG: hypothetical protein MR929_01400, partial [Sutterella wadsworthensis]|nr:hypothetical protein [Sutterella wadsworthensis]
SALFGKIERLTFTGTFDAFQHLVKSHSFKQICFPHRSEMGVLKSFPKKEKYGSGEVAVGGGVNPEEGAGDGIWTASRARPRRLETTREEGRRAFSKGAGRDSGEAEECR